MGEPPLRSINHQFGQKNVEAKLCVIQDSKSPVIIRKNEDPHRITLGRFKYLTALQDDRFKFYFKSEDTEFGEVKEEITEEDSLLPVDDECQIVAWVSTNQPSPTDQVNTMHKMPQMSMPSTNQLQNFGPPLDHQYQFNPQPFQLARRPPPLNLNLNMSSLTPPSPSPPPPLYFYDNLPIPDQFNTNAPTFNHNNGRQHSPAPPTHRPPLPPRPRLEPPQLQQNGNRLLNQQETNSLPRPIGRPKTLYNSFNSFVDLSTASQQAQQETRLTYDEPTTPTSMCNFDLTRQPNLNQRDSIMVIYSMIKVDRESLDVRDREWLKVTFKDTFLGSSLINWLSKNVKGFRNKSEMKRFASKFLEAGLIKNAMEAKEDKAKFSGHRLYRLM